MWIVLSDARGPSQAKRFFQVHSPLNPQKSSGCTSHTITLKNKMATKRATCQFCPLTHPGIVENDSLLYFCFFIFSLNRNCYNLCIFRAKLYRIYTMAWAFYIFQICIMRKWKIFAYFSTSEAYNSCVMFFWPVWGGSGSGGYLVVAKKLWSPVIWGAKA